MKQGHNTDKTRYCSFHKDYGYTTKQCQKLKDEVEYRINNRHLKEYICWDQPGRRQEDTKASKSKQLDNSYHNHRHLKVGPIKKKKKATLEKC